MVKKIYYFFVFLFVLSCFSFYFSSNLPKPYKGLVVRSGSMEPSLPVGAFMVIKQQDDYQVGDVVTFLDEQSESGSITHRVVEVIKEDTTKKYLTKGDANFYSDKMTVEKEKILGSKIFSINYLGFLFDYLRTDAGFNLLILTPIFLIIFGEVKEIKKLYLYQI